MPSSKIKSIKGSGIVEWIDVSNPTLRAIKKLQDMYNLRDIDVNDCLSLTRRSKIDHYDDYTFAIFLYPVFVKDSRDIAPREVDFWIGEDFLISVHHDNNGPITELFNECKNSEKSSDKFLSLPPENLLYEIHLKFINYLLPMVNHLDVDLDNIEQMIFSGHEKEMVKEISIIRRNITSYRKIIEPHRIILTKLMKNFQQNEIYAMQEDDRYFENLIDYAQEIWNTLENFKERIEALQETNESLISFKINDTMNLLAIVSLITLPAALIAAIFGTNMENHPITNFWKLCILMAGVVSFSFLVWFYRRKKLH